MLFQWDQWDHKVHSSFCFDEIRNAKIQYMAIDFEGFAAKYNPEEVPPDWDLDNWKVVDEGVLRHSVKPLLDDCAAKCWMQEDCAYAYAILRKHTDGIDDDEIVKVRPY